MREYVSPYNSMPPFRGSALYRACAVPCEYVPQLKKPVETAVEPPRLGQIVMPVVNGNLPDFQPKLDKSPLLNFEPTMPVMTTTFSALKN